MDREKWGGSVLAERLTALTGRPVDHKPHPAEPDEWPPGRWVAAGDLRRLLRRRVQDPGWRASAPRPRRFPGGST